MTLHFYLGTSASFASGTDLGNSSVRLGDIDGFIEAADKGIISIANLPFDDPAGSLSTSRSSAFARSGWRRRRPVPTRIWSGYIADRNFKRDLQKSQIVGAARTTDPTLVDLNAVVQIRVIAFNDGKRPAETDLARLAWILGHHLPPGV